MNEQQTKKSMSLLSALIENFYPTMREFSRTIHEETSDVSRWKGGHKKITMRALVEICRLHPVIIPWDLRPDVFPENLEFIFKKDK
jgi:uncharacterized membrane protein YkvA (DUF1232 family)